MVSMRAKAFKGHSFGKIGLKYKMHILKMIEVVQTPCEDNNHCYTVKPPELFKFFSSVGEKSADDLGEALFLMHGVLKVLKAAIF